MIARRSISFIVALALFMVAGALAVAGPGEGTFVNLINADRAANGLAPLESMSLLTTYARGHSEEMAAAGEIYHSTEGQLKSITSGWLRIGENVGVGGSVSTLHAAFMSSTGHRANILGDYTHVGIGTVESGGRLYVTEIFMKFPVSSTTTTTTTTTTPPSSSTTTTTTTTSTTTSSTTTTTTTPQSSTTEPSTTTTTTTTQPTTSSSQAPSTTETPSTTGATEPETAPSSMGATTTAPSTTIAPTSPSTQPPVNDGANGFIPSSGPVAPGVADTVRLVAGIVLGAAILLFLLAARRRREPPAER